MAIPAKPTGARPAWRLNDKKKHIRHHNLANEGGNKRIPTWGMCFIAVGSKSALNDIKPGFACPMR